MGTNTRQCARRPAYRLIAGAVAAAVCLVPASTPSAKQPPEEPEACNSQALADYQALEDRLIRRDGPRATRYYEHTGGDTRATVWPHSQTAAAVLDIALICARWPAARRSLAGFEQFARGRAYNPLVQPKMQLRFYDDNAWIALSFVQALKMSGRAGYLDRATRLFSWLQRGLSPYGGLYWNEYSQFRNAATNGPALQLALYLYEETGKTRYLDAAMQLDEFLNTHLRTDEGLILDGIYDNGTIDKRVFSYNQGSYIGASVQLYEATGDPRYLSRAMETASAALDLFNQGDRLWRQPPAFNAIFFRNLLDLDVVAPDPRYRGALEQYLARARETSRLEIGLYQGAGLDSSGPGEPVYLVDQAAFVQMHALLGMSPAQLAIVS
jgi:DUF1680 family protein